MALLRKLYGLALWPLLLAQALAEDWPKGYEVHEGSTSPNGRYAVLVPEFDGKNGELPDYLVDLQEHRLMGQLADLTYFQRQNHCDLNLAWAEDSTFALIELEGRWGYDSLYTLEVRGPAFTVHEFSDRPREIMTSVLVKQMGSESDPGDTQLYCSVHPGRQVRFHGLARTNPKGFEQFQTAYGYFRGVYDGNARQWVEAKGRPLAEPQWMALFYALNFKPGGAAPEPTDRRSLKEQWAEVDTRLNHMYQALKFLLPAEQFAAVKSSQLAWLKQHGKAAKTSAQLKILASRIDELAQQLPP